MPFIPVDYLIALTYITIGHILFYKNLPKILKELDTKHINLNKKLENTISLTNIEVESINEFLRSNFETHADISCNQYDKSYVITIGQYRGMPYVNSQTVRHNDFEYIIRTLKSMNEHTQVKVIDAYPSGIFKEIINKL